MEALIAIGLGDLYAELEDFSVAQLNYHHAEEIVREMNDRFLLYYLIMAQANLALLQNNISEAHQLIDKAADCNSVRQFTLREGFAQLCSWASFSFGRKPIQGN